MNMMLRNASLVAVGLAVFGMAFLAYIDSLIASHAPGITIQLLAVGLMIWARITFGKRSFHAGANPTEGGIETRGPYRYLRHPIYAAATYVVWAGVLSHLSVTAVIVAIVVTLCLVARMLLEEQFLKATYPEYEEYSGRTKRMIPFLF